MQRRRGLGYLPGDSDPCCTRCAEVDLAVVHLLRTGRLQLRDPVWSCPKCKTDFVQWSESERTESAATSRSEPRLP